MEVHSDVLFDLARPYQLSGQLPSNGCYLVMQITPLPLCIPRRTVPYNFHLCTVSICNSICIYARFFFNISQVSFGKALYPGKIGANMYNTIGQYYMTEIT